MGVGLVLKKPLAFFYVQWPRRDFAQKAKSKRHPSNSCVYKGKYKQLKYAVGLPEKSRFAWTGAARNHWVMKTFQCWRLHARSKKWLEWRKTEHSQRDRLGCHLLPTTKLYCGSSSLPFLSRKTGWIDWAFIIVYCDACVCQSTNIPLENETHSTIYHEHSTKILFQSVTTYENRLQCSLFYVYVD